GLDARGPDALLGRRSADGNRALGHDGDAAPPPDQAVVPAALHRASGISSRTGAAPAQTRADGSQRGRVPLIEVPPCTGISALRPMLGCGRSSGPWGSPTSTPLGSSVS